METVIASVSGGETSMLMARLLKQRGEEDGFNVICIFSNVGLENDETLDFVNRCDVEYGLNVIWVEAVTNEKHGKGVTHRVTSYEKAFRFHQYRHPDHPYHAHVRKNGIPNRVFKQCSDRLKEHAIEHYKKVNGLKMLPHAIGIRLDEDHRATPTDVQAILDKCKVTPMHFRNAGLKRLDHIKSNPFYDFLTAKEKVRLAAYCKKLAKYNLIYPMCDWFKLDKIDVGGFWEDQDFQLQLKGYQGNCKTCWKKSDNKLALIALENPEWFDAFKWYEDQYSMVKPTDDGKPRLFFRGNRTTEMILGESRLMDLYSLRKKVGYERDGDGDGCSESCNGYSVI